MNQLSSGQKFGWEKNRDARGRYNTNIQIKFKISMLKSS